MHKKSFILKRIGLLKYKIWQILHFPATRSSSSVEGNHFLASKMTESKLICSPKMEIFPLEKLFLVHHSSFSLLFSSAKAIMGEKAKRCIVFLSSHVNLTSRRVSLRCFFCSWEQFERHSFSSSLTKEPLPRRFLLSKSANWAKFWQGIVAFAFFSSIREDDWASRVSKGVGGQGILTKRAKK